MEETKTCGSCKVNKPLELFYKDKSKACGYRSICKECANRHSREYSEKYRLENKEYFKTKLKKYYKDNYAKLKKYNHTYRKENKDSIKNYRSSDKYKEKVNEHIKIRRKKDIMFKLAGNLRSRIYTLLVLNNYKKNKRTEEILGADYKTVRSHLESTFQEGMTWENHGACKENNCNEVWHIDHKIPLSSAKTKKELIKLCHYTNLQALWADENITKSNK